MKNATAGEQESFRILVADPISEKGIALLREESRFQVELGQDVDLGRLREIIHSYSALIVRSRTRVDAGIIGAGKKLRVIGRAGVGVDNIDVATASKRGVVVINSPGGNSVSTCEHAFSLLLAISRNIPQASAHILSGGWDRGKYQGVEAFNKTLLIIGMGRIGSEVARRATAFGMKVATFDPHLSPGRARFLGARVFDSLDEALKIADYVSLHLPLTGETRHLLGRRRLALCKPGVRIVNCARGGLIDEVALAEALASGQVAAAALDVFEREPPPPEHPLFQRDNVVFTPHLGASTLEAQENVGIGIASSVRDLLLHNVISNSVNMPGIDAETFAKVRPYLDFGEAMGRIASQISPPGAESLRVEYSGKVANVDTNIISRAILKGYLERACGRETVNMVSAPEIARNLGLLLSESHLPDPGEFNDLIGVVVGGSDAPVSLAGTFFGGRPRIVKLLDCYVEAPIEGCWLLFRNFDQPGMVGKVGRELGALGVNIAGMSLSRDRVGGQALTLMVLDSEPSAEALRKIRQIGGIVRDSVRLIHLS